MIKKFFKSTQRKLREMRMKVASLKNEPLEIPISSMSTQSTPVDTTPSQKVEITIRAGTVAKIVFITLLLVLLGALIYQIRDILILFFISLLFAAALDPIVDSLEARKIPRSLGILIIYLVLFIFIGFFVSNLVPVVATEVSQLAVKVQEWITKIAQGDIELPNILEWTRPRLTEFFNGLDVSKVSNYKDVLLNIGQQLSNVAGNVLNGVFTIFNGLFNTVIVLVLTFLMAIDERGIDNFILSLFPSRYADYIRQKSSLIKEKMGYWLRGQVMLCILVGLLTYIGLFVIGVITKPVEYAATIALVAGFTELIPYVGPIVAWIIALPIVANQSVLLIVWLTIVLYIVQVLENNLLVPLIMKRAVGISPIFIMFSMFVGYSLLGIIGMVLAVPVATATSLFIKDYAQKDK